MFDKLQPKTKRIFIFCLIGIFIFGIIIYFTSCRTGKTQKSAEINKFQIDKNITGISTLLINQKIFFPDINNNTAFALSDLGRYFYKFDITNKENKKIMDNEILDPLEVSFSSDNNQAIVVSNYPDHNAKLYNFDSKSFKELNGNIAQVDFSKQSNRIFYSYYDDEKAIWQFNLANPDGSDRTQIAEQKSVGIPIYYLSPTEDKAIVYFKSILKSNKTKTLYINISKKMIEEIDTDITAAKWSPDGQKFVSLSKDKNLSIKNNTFATFIETQIYTELYKIAWLDNNQLIIAVPENFTSYEGTYKDNLYVLNISNNKINKIMFSDNMPIENITYLENINNQIYYVSNENLFKLNLQ